MKIYTKTGDSGDTRLFDGSRVRKHDARVEAYGTVDELNAFLGAAIAFIEASGQQAPPADPSAPDLRRLLEEIQKDLFSVGAQLADPSFRGRANPKFQLPPQRVTDLEQAIDAFETKLPPLRQFILAGGSPAGAMLHVARTVCRRAERGVVALAESVEIDTGVIVYLNRLSDFLFVLARIVNQEHGKQETPW